MNVDLIVKQSLIDITAIVLTFMFFGRGWGVISVMAIAYWTIVTDG